MVEIIEWTIYIIIAGLALTIWAVVARNKREKNQ